MGHSHVRFLAEMIEIVSSSKQADGVVVPIIEGDDVPNTRAIQGGHDARTNRQSVPRSNDIITIAGDPADISRPSVKWADCAASFATAHSRLSASHRAKSRRVPSAGGDIALSCCRGVAVTWSSSGFFARPDAAIPRGRSDHVHDPHTKRSTCQGPQDPLRRRPSLGSFALDAGHRSPWISRWVAPCPRHKKPQCSTTYSKITHKPYAPRQWGHTVRTPNGHIPCISTCQLPIAQHVPKRIVLRPSRHVRNLLPRASPFPSLSSNVNRNYPCSPRPKSGPCPDKLSLHHRR
jgi:hypothetical protein